MSVQIQSFRGPKLTALYIACTWHPEAGLNGRVVVPSRCYFKSSKSRPLDGARISVKDNIDIAGHKTTLCNRSWQELYPAKTKHAACVQVLVDAGAIIVGKAKLQAMIMREEPLECVEFTAPFNPRGDGYQVPCIRKQPWKCCGHWFIWLARFLPWIWQFVSSRSVIDDIHWLDIS